MNNIIVTEIVAYIIIFFVSMYCLLQYLKTGHFIQQWEHIETIKTKSKTIEIYRKTKLNGIYKYKYVIYDALPEGE